MFIIQLIISYFLKTGVAVVVPMFIWCGSLHLTMNLLLLIRNDLGPTSQGNTVLLMIGYIIVIFINAAGTLYSS
jgi:hypothetical protein